MTEQVRLLTMQDEFERLHAMADGRGSVRVERELLRHVLIDYSLMLGALHKASGFTVFEPNPKRQRPHSRP